MRRFGLILITSILTAVAATAWAQIDDGLIAYWNFDACTFQDQSGNGFDNGVAPVQAPECLPGAAGNALEFAGTPASYVRIPEVPVAPMQHSYAFWFRPATALDASSPRQDVLYADVPVVVSGNGRPHITLNHDGDGKIGFHARIIPPGGTIDDAISYNDIKSNTSTWEAGRWYHVAFTWDGEDGRFRVYVDGDLQQTIANRSGTSQTYTGLVLAIRGDLQFPFQGGLDDIRLYDRVLSDAEVQTLAASAPDASVALSVSTEGAGTGTVFSTPTAGIACGAAGTDCTQSYASGTSVTLTAVATPDSVFAGWSGGGCSGTAPCTVAMDQAQEVTATFVPGLTLSVTVAGDGTVTSNPAGIDCGTTCSVGFLAGTEVTLTAAPVTGAVFAGWQGACSGLDPCIVTMNANSAVTATFTSGVFPLSVTNTLGTGTGTVTSSPAGINCGADCDELYPSGTPVTLTPTPGDDSFFYQWGGDCSGTEPCTLIMDQAHTVDAVFALIQTRLTVVKSGTGSGTVSSEPAGINCGNDCGNNYNINTVVTLTATPADAETVFTGWVGGGCSGVEPCEVTMTEDLTVTATFERLSTLNIFIDGDGTGSVVSDPPGIDCGEDCSEEYTGETVITLTATPAADSVFTGWSDPDCPGTGPCVVTLSEGRDITATFRRLFLLEVTKAGTGDGTITANLPGIDCGEDCNETYISGTEITLTASANPDSIFTGWSAAECPGTDSCTVTLASALTITATFERLYTLSVASSGDGAGRITSAPPGIMCGAVCSAAYVSMTSVTLTATPDAGSTFTGWSDDSCPGTGPCVVLMTADRSVTATFENPPPVANAGPDQTVDEGVLVMLDGSQSTPVNGTLSYRWVQTSGPPVTLSNANAAQPTFTSPSVDANGEVLVFELTVTDSRGRSATDSVQISVLDTTPPVANAGADQTVDEGVLVTLDGSQSTPVNGTLSYRWVQTSGPPVTLSDASVAQPTFTSPSVEAKEVVLVFELTVTDSRERSAKDTVQVTVLDTTPPVANAGPDQTVDEGTLVTLDGSQSTAVNGPLSYSWKQTSGTPVTLSDASVAQPTFTSPSVDAKGVVLVFELTVTDSRERSATDSVQISVLDTTPPVAKAGADQTVDEGVLVTLDGSQSTAVNGPLSYSWKQTSGDSVTLSNANAAQATFTSPSVEAKEVVLVFELTVTDSRKRSAKDTVQVTVLDATLPVANAGPDQTVDEGVPVTLDGSQSTAVNGPLNYSWKQTGGDSVTLSNANAARASFISPSVDAKEVVLVFELTVTDSRKRSAKDTVRVTVLDATSPPVANAGANLTVDEGVSVILDGSQSTPMNGTLSYRWVQTSGTPVTLSNANAARASFTSPSVDANGVVLVFELTVTDSRERSATDTVQVTVLDANLPPIANAGPDQRVSEHTQVTLDGTHSSDSDGTIESFVWLQMAGPAVSLSDPTSPQPVFTAPVVTLADGFLPGDTLPGFVLQPRAAGSLADVAARGTYANGQWTVLLTRALTTHDPDADVQFDLSDAAHLYAFSIAYLDNTGAAPPRRAAAAVMATQDTAPYTLGNATSGADLQARRETPRDCSAFTGPPLVTTPADPSVVPALTLQAAYDEVNLYLCVRAPDPNGRADEQPEQWEFLGPERTDWVRQPKAVNVMGGTPEAFDEDRLALWWNINAQDFATDGCWALCHDQRMQSRNADGRADLWHWKAGTTNPASLAQDEGLSADPALCPEHPCRQADGAEEAMAQPNVRWVESQMLPGFMAADDPGVNVRALFADEVPAECVDCALAQPRAEFNDRLEFELTVTDDGGLSDSDRVTVQIVETGGSDTDADGVSNAVEDQAPNSGDGNHDGVVDRRQPHVTSLPNQVNGTYITLEAPSGSVLADVRALPNPSPGNAPPNIEFPLGFLSFVVQEITPGTAAVVTLYLPADVAPTTYYKFGPTSQEPSPHWYEFRFDGATGAELAGDRILLHLQDGQRGDDDLTENGAVMDPGAVAIATTPPPPPPPPPPSGGGGGGGCAMMPGAEVDPTLVAALFLMLAYLGWRRTRR